MLCKVNWSAARSIKFIEIAPTYVAINSPYSSENVLYGIMYACMKHNHPGQVRPSLVFFII